MSSRPQSLQRIDYDFTLAGAVVILMVIGVLFIYSSGVTSAGVVVSQEFVRQIVWVLIGLAVMVLFSIMDYARLSDYALWIYVGLLVLLVYTRIFGKVVNGARSWLGIGDFGIQPSEFMKIATIVMLAKFYDDTKRSLTDLGRFLGGFAIIGVPMLLVLSQPDFGTALVFIPIFLVMSFCAGIEKKYIAYVTVFFLLTVFLMVVPLWEDLIAKKDIPFLMLFSDFSYSRFTLLVMAVVFGLALWGFLSYRKRYYFWIAFVSSIIFLSIGFSAIAHKILKEYQLMRLIVFVDPSVDPRGSGWNIIQSMTAIGSGGLWGKGFLQGTQSHYRFLPEQSTDFIFSIISEEIGLLGSLAVFGLFLLILYRCVYTMRHVRDGFGGLITAGVSAMIAFHLLVNVGMAMGIMPVTGIPLFFLSYGGSSLLTAILGVSLVLSVYVRRFRH